MNLVELKKIKIGDIVFTRPWDSSETIIKYKVLFRKYDEPGICFRLKEITKERPVDYLWLNEYSAWRFHKFND